MPPLPTTQQATSSPKRKRAQIPPTPPSSSPSSNMRVTTTIPSTIETEVRAGSPRTKVAYHFQGLQLEDGIPISKLDFQTSDRDHTMLEEDELSVRKRVKMLSSPTKPEPEIPETPDIRPSKSFNIIIPDTRHVDPIIAEKARAVILHNDIDPAVVFTSGSPSKPKRTSPSVSRPSDYPSKPRISTTPNTSKPLPKKPRSGTPPLSATLSTPFSPDSIAIDPSSLTWHDDEITGHNPTDPDDDGEGINGIGFKPTPAEAYVRAQKRRVQMEAYRTREAREARARRSERRRGEEREEREREKENERKVRFAVEGEGRVGVEV